VPPACASTRTLVIEVPAGKGDPELPADLLEQLRELGNLTETTTPPVRGRRKAKAAPVQSYVLETAATRDVVVTLFEFVMDSSTVRIVEASPPPTREAAPDSGAALQPNTDASASKTQPRAADRASADTSIRVSVEKVDQLINQVGELVITQAMLAQSVGALDPVLHEKLVAGMADLARNTRGLQESVMSIRMLPIAFVFNRFPRLVRDLAAKLGKQVQLTTHGESTELDKGLIERISDPLTHLVRNSIDHGIEAPDVREAAGKPAVGTVTLRAAHAGGNVLIEVGDDGAGLDRERILAKARERGLAVHDGMADADVWNLIFEPGFSTAQIVTDVSGRGVGMDVVRRNIAALSGSVEIESVRGAGTRMTVRLPLTLAIMDGMSVAVGGEVYILPLSSIVESLRITEGQVRSIAGQGLVIDVRGEYLPVLSMHQLFVNGPSLGERASGTLVIVEADSAKVALLVDELLGQHQVVVKSLEANYRKVPGISGATIMGDGRVALILDVATLARERRNAGPRAARLDG
jgi:two-component system chemotaxis sensor kinase CheA